MQSVNNKNLKSECQNLLPDIKAEEINSPLSRPSTVVQILQEKGIDPKYSYGQNFLVNDSIIGKILSLSGVKSGDNVLEIGPGMGVLTLALLRNGARVVAVEKDPDMIEILNENVEKYCPSFKQNLHIVQGDALGINYSAIEEFFVGLKNINSEEIESDNGSCKKSAHSFDTSFKLVANLPYAVAATVILNAFQQCDKLTSATTMIQKEVADRINAKPNSKDYGAYTVKLAMYTRTAGKFKVSPNNFFPPPRVTSCVIRLERRVLNSALADNIRQTNSDFRDIFDLQDYDCSLLRYPQILQTACVLADAAFSHRRKTIRNSMKQYFSDNTDSDIDFNDVTDVCRELNIDLSSRAETLTPDDFIAIAKKLIAVE